jgi:lysozyme
MKASAKCVELIKASEGLRLQTYLDVAGVSTIGWGHALSGSHYYASGISEQQAEFLLEMDISRAESEVESLGHPFTQGQFDALTDFCFNLGPRALKTMFSHGIDQVPEQLIRWIHAGGKVQPGLVRRRSAELELWNS